MHVMVSYPGAIIWLIRTTAQTRTDFKRSIAFNKAGDISNEASLLSTC